MKKVKKLLCILLTYVLVFGTVAVGVSAYEPYTSPESYDSVGNPVYSYQQCCSMILDFVDALLYEKDKVFEIKYSFLIDETLDLRSIDKTFDSLEDLLDATVIKVAKGLGLVGDLDDLSISAIKNPRRSNTDDKTVIYAVLKFLDDNKTELANICNDSFDWGLVDNFVKEDDLPFVMRTAQYLRETLYKLIEEKVLKKDNVTVPASFNLDEEVQKVVNYYIVGTKKTDGTYDGYLPSMNGKTSIYSGEAYTFIQNAIDAAFNDMLLPMLMDMLPEVLGFEVNKEWPNGNPEKPGYFATVISIVNDYLNLGYQYDPEEYPVIELRKFLTWFLVGTDVANSAGVITHNKAAIWDIISFTDHGVDIKDSIMNDIKGILRSLGPGIIQTIFKEDHPEIFGDDVFEVPEGIENFNTDQLVSYLFNLIIPLVLPDVRILPGCDTVRECLAYLLLSFVIDKVPEVDYYDLMARGKAAAEGTAMKKWDPEGDAWIEIGAQYLTFLLNSNIGADIPIGSSFDEMMSKVADWAINHYGFLANTRLNLAGMGTWQKFDAIIFNLIDPSILTINKGSYSYYSEALIKGCILEGAANLDIERILSFIGISSNQNALLHKPVIKVIITLVKDVLKALMNGNTIVPTSVESIEDLLEKNNLGNLVKSFISCLYSERDYNFPTLITLIASLMDLSGNKREKIYAPEGYGNKSIMDLENLVNSYVPDNGDKTIYDEGYETYGSEDFVVLWKYDDFNDTLRQSKRLISLYAENPSRVSQTDINDNYYRLVTYFDELTYRSETTTERALCKTQLAREITYAGETLPAENLKADGSGKLYTDRTWRLFNQALEFAKTINNTRGVRQSMVSAARRNLFAAINSLKAYKALANYRVLDLFLERYQNQVPTDTYRNYTTDSITEFINAIKYASGLDRDYDIDDQHIINDAVTQLTSAFQGLVVWDINYELGADVIIGETVAKDSNTTLKFRESSGAAIDNISCTVNNGALVSEPFTEGDYTCWTITPGSGTPLYSVITAKVQFTQPTTGKTYTAYAYTYVDAPDYSINFNVSTATTSPYVRNAYTLGLYGIRNADQTTVNFTTDHANNSMVTCSTVPTGTVYVDVGTYTNLNEIPGLKAVFRKTAESYSQDYSGSGKTFTTAEITSITSSNSAITLSDSSYSFSLNQTDTKEITFGGAIPAKGQEIMTTVTASAKAVSTSGGTDLSRVSFKLRVVAYDKAALRQAVKDAIAACRQEWFYNSGWDIYVRDLNNAVDILNKPNCTQSLIDEATANLLDAEKWLEFKSADYIELFQAIAVANSLDPNDYINYRTVSAIIDEINAGAQDLNILDQALLNEYATRLKDAIAALKPAEAKLFIRCFDNTPIDNGDGTTSNALLSSSELTGNVGEKVIVDVPVVDGYSPVTGSVKLIVTIENGNVYADFYYTPRSYTINLNGNGGTLPAQTATVYYGQTYSTLPTPTRENFVFDGWYTKLTGGYRVDETTRVTTGYYRTLYAHWKVGTPSGNSVSDMSLEEVISTGNSRTFFGKIIDWVMQYVNLFLGFLFK